MFGVCVPLLIGLDVLEAFGMNIDTSNNTLESKQDQWKIPLVKKRGQLYLKWSSSIMLFTESERKNVHLHFFHPESGRLYSLMRRADPQQTTSYVLQDLEALSAKCDMCQRNAGEPRRFRVALPHDDIVFNRTVFLDLMFLKSKPVLHIVDMDTKFSAASFLERETTEELWKTFLVQWVLPYIGYPKKVKDDQGQHFTSKAWLGHLHNVGIEHFPSGVESHNALGVRERYHDYLRKIFNRTIDTFPNIPPSDALKLSVKAMNDTARPKGLVPTLLVFGALPKIPIYPENLPDQMTRI